MKKLWVGIIGACLFAPAAMAVERTARWTPSVSPNVAGHRIYHKLCAAPGEPVVVEVAGAQVASRVLDLSVGNHCLYMTAYATDGQESVPTPTVQHEILSAPEPPTGFSVGPTSPAFTFKASGDQIRQVAGFVPVGTECSGEVVFHYRGEPYRRVPRETVDWWSTQPTNRVAAACRQGRVIGVT